MTDRGDIELPAKWRPVAGSDGLSSPLFRLMSRVLARVTDGIYRQPGRRCENSSQMLTMQMLLVSLLRLIDPGSTVSPLKTTGREIHLTLSCIFFGTLEEVLSDQPKELSWGH